MKHGTTMALINKNNNDAIQVQLLAQQRSATAQSKAHRRRRLSVYGSPVVILAQKAAFLHKTAAAGRQPGTKFAKKRLIFTARGRNQPPPSPLARWVGPLTPSSNPKKKRRR